MVPTLIYKSASNWVDRGEPANPKIEKVLSHFFERFDASDHAWLAEQANIVIGMVAADATEVHVAAYLRSVVADVGSPTREPLGARPVAISLWHIAKAALVRDFAERVLRGEVPVNKPTPATFSDWMAEHLLTKQELAVHEATRDRNKPEKVD